MPAQTSTDRSSEPQGNADMQRVDTEAQERHVRLLTEHLTLGEGVQEWLSLRLENGELRATIHAALDGRVSVGVPVEVPAAVRNGLERLMETQRKDVRHHLTMSVARTLAAATVPAPTAPQPGAN